MDDQRRGCGARMGLSEQYITCSNCRENKHEECFGRNKGKKTGRNNWCKICMNGYSRSECNLKRRTQRRDEDWSHALMIECRSRARKAGLPFNLTEEDLDVPLLCPVLGIPLYRTRGERADNTPTVDRVINRLGYVKGNVCIISWRANRLKYDCDDPAVFEAIASYIRRTRKPKVVKSS